MRIQNCVVAPREVGVSATGCDRSGSPDDKNETTDSGSNTLVVDESSDDMPDVTDDISGIENPNGHRNLTAADFEDINGVRCGFGNRAGRASTVMTA